VDATKSRHMKFKKNCFEIEVVYFSLIQLLNAIMYRSLTAIIFIIFFISCNNKHSSNKPVTESVHHVNSLIEEDTSINLDSTLTPFSDKSYKLILHVFDTTSHDVETKNTTVTFSRFQGEDVKRIFQDSFYCMSFLIDSQDYNNDNVKDVLFFYSTGARANPTYHLYLADTIKHKLTYINGFENLPNPDFDSAANIITSAALAGTDIIWSFYRINSKNKLINLGNGFTADFGDSIKYEQAIRKIVKEKGK
jgi:hypothetical protein